MTVPGIGQVVEVPVEATFELRRQLLRSDRPDLGLWMPEDQLDGTFHLAVPDTGGSIVGVTTVTPAEPEFELPRPCYRLRQMAVRPDWQRHGVGSVLLVAARVRAHERGAAALWAESRDSSLGFYRSHGMEPIPGRHHRVGTVTYTDVAVELAGRGESA
jgi:GNAT superfamily N-acetyltransferase